MILPTWSLLLPREPTKCPETHSRLDWSNIVEKSIHCPWGIRIKRALSLGSSTSSRSFFRRCRHSIMLIPRSYIQVREEDLEKKNEMLKVYDNEFGSFFGKEGESPSLSYSCVIPMHMTILTWRVDEVHFSNVVYNPTRLVKTISISNTGTLLTLIPAFIFEVEISRCGQLNRIVIPSQVGFMCRQWRASYFLNPILKNQQVNLQSNLIPLVHQLRISPHGNV